MKMNIDHIWLQNWYGGISAIAPEEYFKAVQSKAWLNIRVQKFRVFSYFENELFYIKCHQVFVEQDVVRDLFLHSIQNGSIFLDWDRMFLIEHKHQPLVI